MNEHRYRWRNRELRKHVAIIDGTVAPTLLLKNITYLNVFLKQWVRANIWIYQDRIVYVGDKLPNNTSGTEIVNYEGRYAVSGYIEPHVHPFQLYNPHQLAKYAAYSGTTTLINDNLMWLFLLEEKKAFSIIDDFMLSPVSVYWWSRFDSQSSLQVEEEELFTNEKVMKWLEHPAVVQGGELTAWPQVLSDDDRILYWMQETKQLRKPVEGHLPGASEHTLVKMKLLGVDADHESITGKEVLERLKLGYQVGLRYSSIRPDLPDLLKEIKELGIDYYDSFTMTTDGATPSFYEKGIMNQCIEIAIQQGVPVIDAYLMASYNAARHLGMQERIGSIAPGRVAHINILESKENPNPISVLAKGKWMKKDGERTESMPPIHWGKYGIERLNLDWELQEDDMQFSLPIGMEMVSDVIMKPFAVSIDATVNEIHNKFDEAFLMLIDRQGAWRVNTIIKGFTNSLGAIVSSYSNTGDIVFIGKNKQDIAIAFERMKEIGGGIVLVHNGEVKFELPLTLAGIMYDGSLDQLIIEEKKLKDLLKKYGYPYNDPVYHLLFLSSMHLPYIRITPKGIMDVKKKEVLFPAIMR
ncbi:amidohydrolase family protein [Aquibacillus sp. 3ASR75-11]|uniref:adenine deaminase n=1 Tax=Terrihalobacillus insolitus TaxID=2950438 RepID=A0A9X3WXX3_9BACI|nr:adenine deaminase C-terminal domain-containing protein [Terrihalobacillus insolitus]MDC3414193.1 amidohydrolase family protein [Terrihalobacillus insolitus]MDC3425399.1 amidohydrolase family protein [Terrihalobacillus insolitus]